MTEKGKIARSGLVPFLIFAAFLILAWSLGRLFPLDEAALRRPLAAVPPAAAGAVFVVLYILVTFFLWFSKDVFRLGAALMFGPLVSTLLVLVAELGNCAVLFFFARRMGKEYVERSLPAGVRGVYDRGGRMGLASLAVIRCAPVFPFRFLDLGAGLSSIPFRRYFTASLIGSPLRIFWLQLVFSLCGTAVLKGPQVLGGYLSAHPGVMLFNLLYIVAMFAGLIAVHMKKRERT